MDLSKAFDFLLHDLITAKLQAYGVSPETVQSLNSYLTGCIRLSWDPIPVTGKILSKGSLKALRSLGPLLFNILVNGIFYI